MSRPFTFLALLLLTGATASAQVQVSILNCCFPASHSCCVALRVTCTRHDSPVVVTDPGTDRVVDTNSMECNACQGCSTGNCQQSASPRSCQVDLTFTWTSAISYNISGSIDVAFHPAIKASLGAGMGWSQQVSVAKSGSCPIDTPACHIGYGEIEAWATFGRTAQMEHTYHAEGQWQDGCPGPADCYINAGGVLRRWKMTCLPPEVSTAEGTIWGGFRCLQVRRTACNPSSPCSTPHQP